MPPDDNAATELLQSLADAVERPRAQVEEVYEILCGDGAIAPSVLLDEMRWFYRQIGLDPYYFEITPRPLIARHIVALYGAKILGRASGQRVDLNLESESDEIAIYACRAEHEVEVKIERRLEQKFPGHRLQSYRTRGTAGPDSVEHLRLWFLAPPVYDAGPADEDETDFARIAPRALQRRASEATKERYHRLVERAVHTVGPVIDYFDRPDKGTKQLVVAYRRDTTHSYFSAISDALNYYGLHSRIKYIEQFANGVVLYSIHVDGSAPDDVLEAIREEMSLIYVLPRTALTPLFRAGQLSAQEVVYAYAAWKFAHQFLTRYSDEYQKLAPAFADDPVRLGLLTQFKQRLSKDTFTEDRIFETITTYPELTKALYADFAEHHFVTEEHRVRAFDRDHGSALESQIAKAARSAMDQQILGAFLTFNRHILRTNFYRDSKVALAFRLDPAFLAEVEYPVAPFGIFFVVGSEFRGFHVRFRDVARGGVRVIRSPTMAAYTKNNDFLFDENYRLALTQESKNKDIPEGESKGAILLSPEYQDRTDVALKKYVSALLDLLLPNEEIADHLGLEEILFLGPDEGTAELMDWASEHARTRGYRYWKAFTTGKSVERGGIPHDLYGMTTRSVHQYVLGILGKLSIDEADVSKIQTGGPDGDLGSNEIKISRDRTIAIVDGSGVAFDPAGLDRGELSRLAEGRQAIGHFRRDKLGPQGFVVGVDDRDVTLPDGTAIESGLVFRNGFHLGPYATADLFVPCGGRPDSVHINNVHHLFDRQGQPRVRFIVEGANLFFTQQARRALENAGVVLFKDASANKGGVTSSSQEVFAALALHDDEFAEQMAVRDGRVPDFYRTYVEQLHQRIEENAALEFACIWSEHERTGTPRCELTDQLSDKINRLNTQIQSSSLWQDPRLRRRVLAEACPPVLLESLGLDRIFERVPERYLQAMFAAHLASRYVYSSGLDATELAFYDFLAPYLAD